MDLDLEGALRDPKTPFNKKWDILKPTLERLYLEHDYSVPRIAEEMREPPYVFDANEAQYKYRLKQWGFKKNISASAKRKMLSKSQTRAQQGKSTVLKYEGKEVDDRKLRREAKKIMRAELTHFAANTMRHPPSWLLAAGQNFGSSIYLNWNLPYGVFPPPRPHDHPSPFGISGSTPSNISIHTPEANAPSPTAFTKALQSKTAVERAHSFLRGQHEELLTSLNIDERKILSNWLYQYWFFGFKTAKHWGSGPRNWSAHNLSFTSDQLAAFGKSPTVLSSPSLFAQSPSAASPGRSDAQVQHRHTPLPSQLCHWSIHIMQDDYEAIASPSAEYDDFSSDQDRDVHKLWPVEWNEPHFEQRLVDNLLTNDFSAIEAKDLPIAREALAVAKQSNPQSSFEEAFGFAIMGRNATLVDELLKRRKLANHDVSGLYPLHLAITYLDGSKGCCQILDLLLARLPGADIRQHMRLNDMGHSIFDNLMIAVIRNHSAMEPSALDESFRAQHRFAGEEVDVCGRWDADSECYRSLLRSGKPKVPPSWKHKFCHTSAQAICHCIEAITDRLPPDVLYVPSGLYAKQCFSCGLKLQLSPLHTLVLTAFHLAEHALEDEDLFGMVCCLLAVMTTESLGEDRAPDYLQPAQISVSLLFGSDHTAICSHIAMTATTFAEALSSHRSNPWSQQLNTGWSIIVNILGQHEAEITSNVDGDVSIEDSGVPSEGSDGLSEGCDAFKLQYHDGFRLDCGYHLEDKVRNAFGRNDFLGHIWASAKAELLTYRRLREEDGWLSERFDLDAVLWGLETKSKVSMPLVDNSMLASYCACGRFENRFWGMRTRREDVERFYFSNLEDWNRTTILDDLLVPDEL